MALGVAVWHDVEGRLALAGWAFVAVWHLVAQFVAGCLGGPLGVF